MEVRLQIGIMNFNINILLQLYVVWVKIYCKPALSTFDRLVYFKSSNAVKQVIDLLGEETIMNALVFE